MMGGDSIDIHLAANYFIFLDCCRSSQDSIWEDHASHSPKDSSQPIRGAGRHLDPRQPCCGGRHHPEACCNDPSLELGFYMTFCFPLVRLYMTLFIIFHFPLRFNNLFYQLVKLSKLIQSILKFLWGNFGVGSRN